MRFLRPAMLLFLLALAALGTSPPASAARREGVVVTGTTAAPVCARPEGKLQTRCPATHPFNYGSGDQFCCKYHMSANDGSLDESCDGTRLGWNSHQDCCPLGQSVACTDMEKGCHRNGVQTNYCEAMPTVVTDDKYSSNYPAANIMGNEACTYRPADQPSFNFWHGVLNAPSHFKLDFGCPILITRFEIRNEDNYELGNVATDTFKIEVSEDDSAWIQAVAGSLADPAAYADCKRPLEMFEPAVVPTKARYVRFTALTYLVQAAALKTFRVRHVNEGAPRCTGSFKMVQKDPEFSDLYPAENVFTDDGCDISAYDIQGTSNYWLLPNGVVDAGFTLDYGCPMYITLFELRNTQNWPSYDRATNAFEIMASDYFGGWKLVASGSLPDPSSYKNCGEIPLSRFAPTAGIIRARFIKFIAKSYHGVWGAGLQYFNVVPYVKREGYNCNPNLAITEASVNSGSYPVTNMFTDECEATTNMWLLPDGEVNSGFTLDYGCDMLLTKFDIKNTGINNRGTKDFEIHVSRDGAKWTKVIDDTLPDISGLSCDQYIKKPYFPSTGPTYARHVRFRSKSHYGAGAGLQFFHAAFKGIEVTKAHCPSSVIIDPDSDPHHSTASPENIFHDACDDNTPSYNTWLPPTSATGDQTFILDYGCPILITKFQLKNARDADGTRSTKDFAIDISFDKEMWTEVVSDALTDVRASACSDVPLMDFAPAGGVTFARYIRFTVKTFYGTAGGGLRYFSVIHRDHEIYCPANPKVDPDSDAPYHDPNIIGGFTVEKILIDECELRSGNYWLAPVGATNVAAILDYGCEIEFTKVQIKNSINEPYGDTRSTGQFTVETSLDKRTWTEIVADTFPDPIASGYTTCATMPLSEYDPPGGVATAKFIRITLKTHYFVSAGISYFSVVRSGTKTFTPPSVCKVERAIHSQSRLWNDDYSRYGAHNILLNPVCDNAVHKRWVPGIGNNVQGHFILDMGCEVFVKHYIVTNDNNLGSANRAVKGFTIEASQDLANWVTSVSGQEMINPGNCDTPFNYVRPKYHVDHRFVKARYFRFTALPPGHWYGSCLNNFEPQYHMAPPPVNED